MCKVNGNGIRLDPRKPKSEEKLDALACMRHAANLIEATRRKAKDAERDLIEAGRAVSCAIYYFGELFRIRPAAVERYLKSCYPAVIPEEKRLTRLNSQEQRRDTDARKAMHDLSEEYRELLMLRKEVKRLREMAPKTADAEKPLPSGLTFEIIPKGRPGRPRKTADAEPRRKVPTATSSQYHWVPVPIRRGRPKKTEVVKAG
jgi:hypothetical protein